MTNWKQVSVNLEIAMEHVQSSWVGLGTYSFAERYEQRWPIGTPQYHLRVVEQKIAEVRDELAPMLSEWDVEAS